MIPYFIFLFLVLLMLCLYKKTKKELYFRLVFFVIFLFVAFRGNGSGDYFTYLEYSDKINSLGDVLDGSFCMEVGFRIISYIKNIINLPDQFVIIVMAFISVYLTFYFIEKFSKDKALSTIIYLPLLLQFDMHATRSAIAASAGCLALFFMYEKKYKISFLYLLFGLCFHRSVLILLLCIVVKVVFDNITDKKYVIFSFVIVALSLFISLKQFILGLSTISFLKSNIIMVKLSQYFLSDKFAYPINVLDPRVLLVIFVFVLSLICIYFNNKNEKQVRFFSYILFLNALITLLFKESTFLTFRLNSFFDRNTIVILPYLLNYIANKMKTLSFLNISFIKKIICKETYLFSFVYVLYYVALVLIATVPYYLCF